MHSPYYSNPCSKTCKVCNMDKQLYTKVRELIDKEKAMEGIIIKYIVQFFNEEYEDWFDWCDGTTYPIQFRFDSLEDAKEEVKEYKNSFHYSPAHYRFVKIQIKPETVVERDVEETHWLGE